MQRDNANAVSVGDIQAMLAEARRCVSYSGWGSLIEPRHLAVLNTFYLQLTSSDIPPQEFKETVRFYTAAALMVRRNDESHQDYTEQAVQLLKSLVADVSLLPEAKMELNALLAQLYSRQHRYHQATEAALKAMELAVEQRNPLAIAGAGLLQGCINMTIRTDSHVRLRALKGAAGTLKQLAHRSAEQQLLLLVAHFALHNHYGQYGPAWRRWLEKRRGTKLKACLAKQGLEAQANWVLRMTPIAVPMFLPV